MHVTIDIPEPLYRELEQRAAVEKKSIQDALLEQAFGSLPEKPFCVQAGRRRVHLPLIPAGEPGRVDLSQNLNDAFFDDFDPS